MRKTGCLRACAVPAAALVMCASLAAQKLPWHGRQAEVLTGLTRVLLVPPDVHVDEWSTTSGRELSATGDYTRRTICGTLDQFFEEKKVEVYNYALCLGEAEVTQEQVNTIRALQTRFRELVTAWEKPRRQADLLDTFHLGEEGEQVKKLAVDALVMVCADGNLRTKGEKTASRFGGLAGGGGAPSEGVLLHIGMIRPRTGELLFFTLKDVAGDFLKHEDKFEAAIEKAVRAAFEAPAASTPAAK